MYKGSDLLKTSESLGKKNPALSLPCACTSPSNSIPLAPFFQPEV